MGRRRNVRDAFSARGLRFGYRLAFGLGAVEKPQRRRSPRKWNRWVATSVLFNFVLPLGMVWMLFGQGLVHQNWLRDQKHNAWDYGWRWNDWRKHLKIALVLWAVMLPFLIYFLAFARRSRSPTRIICRRRTRTRSSGRGCWFRWRFICFAGSGFFAASACSASRRVGGRGSRLASARFVLDSRTLGKPPAEMWSAFGGGLILGALCWREKSFVPAFFTHALVHCSFAVLVKV